jgi:hypothetical protein
MMLDTYCLFDIINNRCQDDSIVGWAEAIIMITLLNKIVQKQWFNFFSWGYFNSAGYFELDQLNRLFFDENLNISR